MDKIKRFVSAHRFFFCLYFALLLYCFYLVNNGYLGSTYYSYHAVDFSMGFCTKLLPGAIYNLLVGVYNQTAIATYVRIVSAIFWLLVCIILERFFLSVERKYKPAAMFLLALMLLGPISLNLYAREMGMLDLYWALFFAISILLVKTRIGKFFIPVLIFAMVLTHFGSMLSYIPALLLIIFYLSVTAKSKTEKVEYAILFVVGLVVALVSTGYFAMFERSNLTYTVDEFNKVLASRGATYRLYYDYAFYRYYPPEAISAAREYKILDIAQPSFDSGLQGALYNLYYQVRSNLLLIDFKKDWYIIAISAVVISFIVYLLLKCFKSASKRLEKVVIILMIAFSPFVLCGWLLSTDIVRWLGTMVVVLLTFLFSLLYFGEKVVVLKPINKLIATAKPVLLSAIMFIYAFLPYSPYD